MVGCSVLGCKSRSERKIVGITFHTFPSDLDKKKWLDATGRENWLPTKYSKICSIHFDDDSFLYKNKRVQLKPHLVPIKNIHIKPNQDQSSNHDDVPLIHPSTSKSDHTMSPVSTNLCPQQENTPLPATSQESKERFNISLSPPNKRRKVVILREVQNIQPKKSTVAGPSYEDVVEPLIQPATLKKKNRLENLLQKEKIKSNNLRQKLRAVRESKRRLVKKTAYLQDIITELKCKLQMQSEELDLLSNIESENADFLKRYLDKTNCPRKYSPSLRKFALCLHFLSPKAYTFVRKQFNTCLPYPKTLSDRNMHTKLILFKGQ